MAMSTSAQRQARYRARRQAAGLVHVTILVPSEAGPELQLSAEAMRQCPHLLPGPLRDPNSGKLVSARKVLAAGTPAGRAGQQ